MPRAYVHAMGRLARTTIAVGAAMSSMGPVAVSATDRPADRPGAVEATPSGPVQFEVDDPAFFLVPNPVPAGEHGTLLRFQFVDDFVSDVWRIMYLSTSVSGQPIVVTGLVSIPGDEAPFGGYPMLLYGHGTVGMADRCAPSRYYGNEDEFPEVQQFGPGYASEFETVQHTDQWVVVATDYEGLATPGRHPYLVGVSEGRSMLDAGLAARQLPVLYASTTTGLMGFSQGGHAALWAAQLAAEWAPSLDIVGSVLAAPATDPGFFASRGASDPSVSPQTVWIAAALAAAHPEAEAALGSVLTPAGLEMVAWWDEHCFEDLGEPSGPMVSADPTTVEPFASLLAANRAGTVASPAPMLVFHYPEDANVPIEQSTELLTQLCAAGQTVERRPPPTYVADETLSTVVHSYAGVDASVDGVAWLSGLLDGTTTPASSC
jgi:hypothetical protein